MQLPRGRNLLVSLLLHSAAVAGLFSIQTGARPAPPKPQREEEDKSTTIRIGDRTYLVSQLFAPPPRKTEPAPAPAARKGAKKMVLKRAAVEAQPAPRQNSGPAPRAFIPPEVKKNLISEATLIQPASPPDLIPVVPQLPSFRVWTAPVSAPKIVKPFVAPGRKTPPPPQPPTTPPPPNLELVHADPVPYQTRSALTLPPTPPPLMDTTPPKTSPDSVPVSPAGDPVNILSLNDRPVPPSDKLVVPPGNVVGRLGDGSVGSNAANGSGSSKGPERSPGGVEIAAAGTAASSTGAGATGGVTITGSSRGSKGSATAGAVGTGLGTGPGTGPGSVITRPATGNFDAVVVQNSPLDQFPETKGMLSGRPIYSVYVSVGTAKEWALYFCLPGEKMPVSVGGNVVSLGTVTPVQAPYPTRLVRPAVSVPAYERYILVHGFVTTAGRFEELKVVRPLRPETDQALVASLSGWEFRAATKDGVKVTVEFILSIPINGL